MCTTALRAMCGALAVSCLAAADTQAFKVARIGHRTIDVASGEMTRGEVGAPRGYTVCWDATCRFAYFFDVDDDEVLLEWGDLPPECVEIDSFRFGYATNATGPQALDIAFYVNDEGSCDEGRILRSLFRLNGLPSSDGHDYIGWIITVIPPSPIFMGDAADLDGDGYGDISYSMHYRTFRTASELLGPLVTPLDSNCGQPGNDSFSDLYTPAPDIRPGPNAVWLPEILECFPFFGNHVGDSLYMVLLHADGSIPSPGCNSCPGDIEPPDGDTDVDLSDLAALLAHYGVTSGATCNKGDIQPAGGDGDVDLSDLALMLGRFGTPCFNPPMP